MVERRAFRDPQSTEQVTELAPNWQISILEDEMTAWLVLSDGQ